ncbi:MAG: glycosyltransferase family 2 protein [Armatimonadetes bacterium]|nr:glycosyltransferase family 2 protein [Armatimonadota bacterium]
MITMDSAPSKDTTCAVVVTYHPDSGLPGRLARLAEEVDRILVVDNASGPADLGVVKRAAAQLPLDLILNQTNLGIATALNQGLQWAISHGYQWVLTFDQDSTPMTPMLAAMREAYLGAGGHRVAVIGSLYVVASPCNEGEHGTADGAMAGTPRWQECATVITSGSLLSTAAHTVVGPFRDEFFIDLVDLEYCLRARRKGFRVLITRDSSIRQPLGSPTEHRFLGRRIVVTNHSPLRRYYHARNLVAVAAEYWRGEREWAADGLRRQLRMVFWILLFERRKAAKIAHIALGVWHGMRRRFGPLYH